MYDPIVKVNSTGYGCNLYINFVVLFLLWFETLVLLRIISLFRFVILLWFA
jgi:hypothetical protein